MKKVLILSSLFLLSVFFTGCKSIPEEAYYSQEYIYNYYAESDEDCSFIFEFINQSNRPLKLEGYISETSKLINQYDPIITSELLVVEAGECLTFKINADKLIKDFSKKYSIGINCFEKNWHWWQTINKGMKNNRFRVVVKNDSQEGGQLYNPPFKSKDKFEFKEFSVEYENRNYMAYLITETPDEYKNVFDTRIFYTNNSNSYGRVSNIYACGCQEIIMEMLNKGAFSIKPVDGYKCLMLNDDPLDLNIYIAKDNYDFIYEIINTTNDPIVFANIILDKTSNVLSLTDDITIEPTDRYQLTYNLKELEKIYGPESLLGIDFKKPDDKQWVRGFASDYNHINEKHTVVVSEGTQGRSVDSFDLWSDFPELEKGILIY